MFSQKYQYLKIAAIAVIVAMVVWCLLPKEYSATIKIADEYKEMDLIIGLSHLKRAVKEMNPNNDNEGQNDMEIYVRILESQSFLKDIAYIQNVKTDHVEKRLLYNLHTRQGTLDIQYTDKNPHMAQMMLDSIVYRLQKRIWEYRYGLSQNNYNNSIIKVNDAQKRLDSLRNVYAIAKESHRKTTKTRIISTIKKLEKQINAEVKLYNELKSNLIREKALMSRKPHAFVIIQCNTVHDKLFPNIWSIILSFLSFALIASWLYITKKNNKRIICQRSISNSIFSPWNITIGIWGIILSFYYIQSNQLEPISEQFWRCLAVWIPGIVLSSYITFNITNDTVSEGNTISINRFVFHSLWAITIILSPLYLYTVMKVIMQFDTTDLLYNIRLLAVYGRATSLILNSTQGINIALFIAALWMYPQINKIQLFTIILSCLLVEFAMMEKSGILIMIISTLFVLYQRKAIKVRSIIITLAFTVAFFYFFNMSKEMESQDTTTFVDFFAIYITTPAVAFGHLKETVFSQFGENTFGQIYMYLNAFGFNFDYKERMQEFVFVPVPTNVYTIFQPFYQDFGITGVFVFSVLYGTLFGYVYAMFRNGNSTCKILYTYLVEVIIIQFYNENLMQNLFMSVCLVLWSLLLTTKISGITIKLHPK